MSTEWPLEIKFILLLFFIIIIIVIIIIVIIIITTVSWLLSVSAYCLCINDLNDLKED